MVQGLIGMQEGVISERTHIVCNRDVIGCHGAHTQDDLRRAIVHSCNPYFYDVMRRMVNQHPNLDKFDNARLGLGWWTERIKDFGLGTDLGGHVPGTRSGLVPDTTYYDKIYGRRHWTFRTIYSISIGEGELLATPCTWPIWPPSWRTKDGTWSRTSFETLAAKASQSRFK